MATKQGAKVSNKTIALTAIDGRKVTFFLSEDWSICGYICGMDDYHWRIVTPMERVFLCHKSSVPMVEIHIQPSYVNELTDLTEKLVQPFRDAMVKEYKSNNKEKVE